MKRKQAIVLTLASAITLSSTICANAQGEGLNIMVNKDGKILNDSVIFEIVEADTNKIVFEGSSVNSMLNANYKFLQNKKYALRVSSKDPKYTSESINFYIYLDIPIKSETGTDLKEKYNTSTGILDEIIVTNKTSSTPESPQSPNEIKINSIKAKVLINGNPIPNSDVRLMKWDLGIPNIVSTDKKTDINGEITFGDFDANSKYEIRMANNAYKFDHDFVTIETDKDKNIIKIDNKQIDKNFDGVVKFNAANKKDDVFKLHDLSLKVQYEDGRPAEGVEITANTVTPKLSSYKNEISDKNGIVKFKLEGQEGGKIYSFCVSKNGQFLLSFKPETIDITMSNDGEIKTSNNIPLIITVKKDDKSYLKKIVKEKIELAEKLLSSSEYKKESKLELEKALKGAKDEMSKPETIPTYVQGAIDNIDNGIKKLIRINTTSGSYGISSSSNNTPQINKEKTIEYTRIAGKDRIDTSIEVSKKEFTSSDTVLIANGYNYVDALTAAPLASMHNAPLLLTDENMMRDSILNEIKRLDAKNIIIIGGENSISSNSLANIPKDLNITRIAGEDRFETSWMIAEKVMKKNNSENVILSSGFNLADSLSASSLIQKYNAPIVLYDNACKCGANNTEALKTLLNKNFIVLGGENSITKKAESDFNVIKRYAGKDRYETSKLVAKEVFKKDSSLFLASGKNFADALSISPVLSKHKAPLLLVNDSNVKGQIKNFDYSKLIVVGGNNTISDFK